MSERHHTPKVFIAGSFKALGKREIYKLSVGSTLPYVQGNVLLTQYNVTYNDFTAMGICLWAVNIEFTLFYDCES